MKSGLFLTTDLIAPSRALSFARQQNLCLTVVPNPAKLQEGLSEETGLVILDLQFLAGANLSELIARTRENSPTATVIAYGPHVHEQSLQAASEAGCDVVLTRGQFHQQTDELLQRYLMAEWR